MAPVGRFRPRIPLEMLVHRHRQLVASERAAACGLSRPFRLAKVSSWIAASFLQRGMPCVRRQVTATPQQKALVRLQAALWDCPGKCHGI